MDETEMMDEEEIEEIENQVEYANQFRAVWIAILDQDREARARD